VNYTYTSNSPTNNFNYTINIGKSFGDIDSTIIGLITSKNNLTISEIQAEIRRLEFIDKIISTYISISDYRKRIEIEKNNIERELSSLQIIEEKVSNGREMELNLMKFSNEILLKKDELELNLISLDKKLKNFEELVGVSLLNFVIKGELEEDSTLITDFEKNNQYYLSIKSKGLEISNNNLAISKKNRESFLPILGLSAGANYNFATSSYSYTGNISFNFAIFDFMRRQNEIKVLELKNKNIINDITNTYADISYNSFFIIKQISLLEKKITNLEENLNLEKQLFGQYQNKYKNEVIDFYDFMKFQNLIYDDEIILLDTKNQLRLLKKRMKYGILKL
jgi:outer membrane protein TolC